MKNRRRQFVEVQDCVKTFSQVVGSAFNFSSVHLIGSLLLRSDEAHERFIALPALCGGIKSWWIFMDQVGERLKMARICARLIYHLATSRCVSLDGYSFLPDAWVINPFEALCHCACRDIETAMTSNRCAVKTKLTSRLIAALRRREDLRSRGDNVVAQRSTCATWRAINLSDN